MIRRVPAALIPLLVTLVALVIQTMVIVATAQVNITVTPDAPQPVKSGLVKLLDIASFVTIAAGVIALLWGGFKLATGQEGAGRWLVGGAAALIIGFGINEIVAWLTA